MATPKTPRNDRMYAFEAINRKVVAAKYTRVTFGHSIVLSVGDLAPPV